LAAESGSEPAGSVAFIGFGDNFGPAPARRWIDANIPPGRLVAKANSAHCMLQLALQGFGATLLPCFLGDRCPDLARVGYVLPELDIGVWMLTHSDLRRSARVRAFMDFAGAELTKQRRTIEGEENGATD
jgi:DNA-binding transcriptional LysR family regulator